MSYLRHNEMAKRKMTKYGEGVMGGKPLPKIGVFDSGVGGLSVAKAIQAALPEYRVIYAADKRHLPYGNKPLRQIHGYVLPILKDLVDQGCQVIVIACNTVTTTMIDTLRQEVSVPLVGMEPMVKPAASLTKSGIIAVCATPNTLASARYSSLKKVFAKNLKVLEPDCSDWVPMIENNQINRDQINKRIETGCQAGADVIVLGCTHYHWIEQLIKDIVAGRATVLQPEQPVIEQLRRVLTQLA